MTKQKQLKASSIKEFLQKKREEELGVVMELPSGLFIRLKKVDIKQLILLGLITDELFELGIRVGTKDKKETEEKLTEEVRTKQLQKYIEICEKVIVHVAIEPKFTFEETNEKEGLLNVDVLSNEDKFYILKLVLTGSIKKNTSTQKPLIEPRQKQRKNFLKAKTAT